MKEKHLFDFVADCHCDSILRPAEGEYASLISPYNVSNVHRFLQLFAVFIENGSGRLNPDIAAHFNIPSDDLFGCCLRMCGLYKSVDDGFVRCASLKDVMTADKNGQSCGFLAVEGAGFADTLEKLHVLYGEGVRFITLTWNYSNVIACGCSVTGTPDDKGLTSYGREFVRECGRLGIAVDLSHASVRTMYDVLEYAEGPVLATHSNFAEVCPHVRNLPEEIASGIVEKGGFIGLNTYLPFVRPGVSFEDYEASMLFDHIGHALEKGWGNHIGFGFDIDGVEAYAKDISLDKSIHDQYLDLLENSRQYTDGLVYGMRCGNFLDFLERNGF